MEGCKSSFSADSSSPSGRVSTGEACPGHKSPSFAKASCVRKLSIIPDMKIVKSEDG